LRKTHYSKKICRSNQTHSDMRAKATSTSPKRRGKSCLKSSIRIPNTSETGYSICWTLLRQMPSVNLCRWRKACWIIKKTQLRMILKNTWACTNRSIRSYCRPRISWSVWLAMWRERPCKFNSCQTISANSMKE
jgi:hypothetical protein